MTSIYIQKYRVISRTIIVSLRQDDKVLSDSCIVVHIIQARAERRYVRLRHRDMPVFADSRGCFHRDHCFFGQAVTVSNHPPKVGGGYRKPIFSPNHQPAMS